MNLNSVSKYVARKYHSQPQRWKQIEFLLHHSLHVLEKLNAKRIALSRGIKSLKRSTVSILSILTKHENTTLNKTSILQNLSQHWFIQYLRLRDGFVLIQSGECRHKPDQMLSISTSYKSQLTRHQKRSDGYTSLFSASHYSGFGWDEFYDDERGIKARLCRLLMSKNGEASISNTWDKWSEKFPALSSFEDQLDHHEVLMRELVEDLEAVRKNFLKMKELPFMTFGSNTNKLKVFMSTKDKFECLQLTIPNQNGQDTIIQMERQGNDFRIDDKDGVLPENWTDEDWDKITAWKDMHTIFKSGDKIIKEKEKLSYTRPSKQRKLKRRRVIDDDSDESEDIDNNFDGKTKSSKTLLANPSTPKAMVYGKKKPTTLENEKNNTQRAEGQSTKDPGLKIKVKINSDNAFKENNIEHGVINGVSESHTIATTSLNAIKMQLGVDNMMLQTSREFFENEQKEAIQGTINDFFLDKSDQKGNFIEDQQNINQIREDISQAKEEFLLYKQNYKDVLHSKINSFHDDVESWDARESLRESSMHLGNLYLNLSKDLQSSSSSYDEACYSLDRAQSKFNFAIKMIKEQNIDLNNNKLISQQSTSKLKRNLLLLEARALSNLAISLIEKAEMKKKMHHDVKRITSKDLSTQDVLVSINDLLQKGISFLEGAKHCSRSLFAQITIEIEKCEDAEIHEELEMDKMDCFLMEYLSCRWCAIALWNMMKYKDSLDLLEKYALAERNFAYTDDEHLTSSTILVLVERYLCSMLITELVAETFDKNPNSGFNGEEAIQLCLKWFHKASSLSDMIMSKLSQSFTSLSPIYIREKYGLKESSKLKQEAQDIRESWKKRLIPTIAVKEKVNKPSLNGSWTNTYSFRTNMPRNEVGPSYQRPTRHINASEFNKMNSDEKRFGSDQFTSSMFHRNSSFANGSRNKRTENWEEINGNFANIHLMTSGKDCYKKPDDDNQRKYRKWGDELLPEISYPACAPEISSFDGEKRKTENMNIENFH